jgi:hypothetical protein
VPEHVDKRLLADAEAAIDLARSVRRLHARRSQKGGSRREADIQNALDRLKTAMRPLRPVIARFPYEPQTVTAEANRQRVRALSTAMQRERRKLWKMQARVQ